jgi:hypothetical protein
MIRLSPYFYSTVEENAIGIEAIAESNKKKLEEESYVVSKLSRWMYGR